MSCMAATFAVVAADTVMSSAAFKLKIAALEKQIGRIRNQSPPLDDNPTLLAYRLAFENYHKKGTKIRYSWRRFWHSIDRLYQKFVDPGSDGNLDPFLFSKICCPTTFLCIRTRS